MSTESIFCNFLLFVVLIFPFCMTATTQKNRVLNVPTPNWGVAFGILAAWCMANVPIYVGSWSDRGAYASTFINFAQYGYQFEGLRGEPLFGFYMWLVSLISSDYHVWFYLTAIIYVGNYFITANRLTKEYSYVMFLSMLCCFQFFGYGNNTIRAGFAGSLVMLGLGFCNKKTTMLFFFIMALFCHKSMAIPIGAFMISYFLRKQTNFFLTIWFLSIGVSLFAGSAFEGYFSQFVDSRRANYFMVNAAQSYYRVGFRWDFLAYSFIAVALGYYYIYVLNYKSEFYQWVYNAYLIANSFWILVIKAEFTDRFAYLSWFMFSVILFYPLLSQQLYRDVSRQRTMVLYLLWGQFAFTYYMFLAYNGFKPF